MNGIHKTLVTLVIIGVSFVGGITNAYTQGTEKTLVLNTIDNKNVTAIIYSRQC